MKSRIEKIPKDVVEKITNELTSQDFVKFCQNDYAVCKSNDVFYRRIQKDFPFLLNYFDDLSTNSKQIYLKTFSTFSQTAEYLVAQIMNSYGNFAKQLNSDYEKNMYLFIFNILIETFEFLLNYYTTLPIRDDLEFFEVVSDVFYNSYYEFKNDYLPAHYKVTGNIEHRDYLQYDEPWRPIFDDEIDKLTRKMFEYLGIEIKEN